MHSSICDDCTLKMANDGRDLSTIRISCIWKRILVESTFHKVMSCDPVLSRIQRGSGLAMQNRFPAERH